MAFRLPRGFTRVYLPVLQRLPAAPTTPTTTAPPHGHLSMARFAGRLPHCCTPAARPSCRRQFSCLLPGALLRHRQRAPGTIWTGGQHGTVGPSFHYFFVGQAYLFLCDWTRDMDVVGRRAAGLQTTTFAPLPLFTLLAARRRTTCCMAARACPLLPASAPRICLPPPNASHSRTRATWRPPFLPHTTCLAAAQLFSAYHALRLLRRCDARYCAAVPSPALPVLTRAGVRCATLRRLVRRFYGSLPYHWRTACLPRACCARLYAQNTPATQRHICCTHISFISYSFAFFAASLLSRHETGEHSAIETLG